MTALICRVVADKTLVCSLTTDTRELVAFLREFPRASHRYKIRPRHGKSVVSVRIQFGKAFVGGVHCDTAQWKLATALVGD